jgi:AbrB family looped-hinge helix DNA binding protein
MKSTVSSKGQITLPVEIRDQLGLRPGVVVSIEPRGDGVFVRKGTSGEHPVDRVFGRLRLEKPVDALLDEMRGPRPGVSRKKK